MCMSVYHKNDKDLLYHTGISQPIFIFHAIYQVKSFTNLCLHFNLTNLTPWPVDLLYIQLDN